MRFLLSFTVILCLATLVVESKKKGWEHEQTKAKDLRVSKFKSEDWVPANEIEKKHHDLKISERSHKDKMDRKVKWHQKKSKSRKHSKFGHGDMSWVTIIHDSECIKECERGEVCIMGPLDSKHLCVRKKDLKKSVKLFYKYQKREMKAWNKFKKQKYGHGHKDEKYDLKKDEFSMKKKDFMMKHGHMKGQKKGEFDMGKSFEKMGPRMEDFDMEKRMKHHKMGQHMKDSDMEKRMKHHKMGQHMEDFDMEKHMKHHKMDQHIDNFKDKSMHHHKMGKHMQTYEGENFVEKPKDMVNVKTQTDLSFPQTPVEAGSDEDCKTSQFSQMRGRMMGWFHLLHGQDHLARQAHGGSLKHFYKHVSVKKELREHDGDKCECLKSAMWQFHQMDKNVDDHLTPDELLELEQDSLEPCMKPYLTSCDRNADSKLSSDEWCCCFSSVVAPCFKKLDELRQAGDTDSYVPACDKEGYYMREQCVNNAEDDNMSCWCVDYNGNERKGTHTKGRAHCHKMALRELESGKTGFP